MDEALLLIKTIQMTSLVYVLKWLLLGKAKVTALQKKSSLR